MFAIYVYVTYVFTIMIFTYMITIKKDFYTHKSLYTLIDLLYATPVSFGIIRIQNIETRLYLAFKKGRLYGEIRCQKKMRNYKNEEMYE